MQKSALNTKGRFTHNLGSNSNFWTLSLTINTCEFILTYFQLFFLSFFLLFLLFHVFFSRALIFFFGTPTIQLHGFPGNPFSHTCFSSNCRSKGIPSKSCSTILKEQGYGYSYSRLGKDNVVNKEIRLNMAQMG